MLVEPHTYKIHLEAYKQWIAATAVTISKYQNQSIPVNLIEKEAQDIVQFEIDLAKVRSIRYEKVREVGDAISVGRIQKQVHVDC